MTVYNLQNMSLEELEKTRAELWRIYQDAVCYSNMTEHPCHKSMWGETAHEAWEDVKVLELVIRGWGGRPILADCELKLGSTPCTEPETRSDRAAGAEEITWEPRYIGFQDGDDFQDVFDDEDEFLNSEGWN